jgi:hypothetical protein
MTDRNTEKRIQEKAAAFGQMLDLMKQVLLPMAFAEADASRAWAESREIGIHAWELSQLERLSEAWDSFEFDQLTARDEDPTSAIETVPEAYKRHLSDEILAQAADKRAAVEVPLGVLEVFAAVVAVAGACYELRQRVGADPMTFWRKLQAGAETMRRMANGNELGAEADLIASLLGMLRGLR